MILTDYLGQDMKEEDSVEASTRRLENNIKQIKERLFTSTKKLYKQHKNW